MAISNTAAEQARRQRELQAHLDRIASGAITRRDVPRDQMTYQDEYDAARQDAAKSDPAYQVGVPKDVDKLNKEFLEPLGLPPVTSLDEFLTLVRNEASASLETGGGIGIYGQIYNARYPGDTWGIFGVPDWKKQGLPDPTVPGAPPPEISPDGTVTDVTVTDGTVTGGSRTPQSEQTISAVQQMISEGGAPIQEGTATQFRRVLRTMLDDTDPSSGMPLFPNMAGLRRDDPAWHFSDQVQAVQNIYNDIIKGRQAGVSSRAQELDMINQTITAAQNQRELELRELDAERDYELARSNLFLKATEAMEQGRQFDQQYALEFQRAQNNLDQVNRELDLQEQRLGLESRTLDIRQGESLQDARLRREQMALDKYQTDIANPFNVAALNLLTASPASRALTGAQDAGVNQATLNTALETAQFHSGRQGLSADDPQLRSMAARLVPQMTDPRQKAAMEAIAQGVTDITQFPQQQTGMQAGMTIPQFQMPSQPVAAGAIPEREFQPVGTPFTMPATSPTTQVSANYGQGAIPQALGDIGFRIPQGAAYGQQTNIRDFFPQGLPIASAISQLPSMSKGLLGATAESTGTSAEDLVQASRNITPSVAGQSTATQPTLQRLLRNRKR